MSLSMIGQLSSLNTELFSRISLWSPIIIQYRFRTKPNLKTKPNFFSRQRALGLCKPIYPDPYEICFNHKKIKAEESIKENKYGLYLARKLREKFENSPMIAIFHSNSITLHQILHMRGMLYDNKFEMDVENFVNSKVAQEALTGTKFEPVLQLLVSRTSLGFCPHSQFMPLLKVIKKMPQHLLIGLIFENRLLHKADIDKLTKIRDIDSARAELLHILQKVPSQLCDSLTANQRSLTTSLSTLASPEMK